MTAHHCDHPPHGVAITRATVVCVHAALPVGVGTPRAFSARASAG
jgi:hypothetical protein